VKKKSTPEKRRGTEDQSLHQHIRRKAVLLASGAPPYPARCWRELREPSQDGAPGTSVDLSPGAHPAWERSKRRSYPPAPAGSSHGRGCSSGPSTADARVPAADFLAKLCAISHDTLELLPGWVSSCWRARVWQSLPQNLRSL